MNEHGLYLETIEPTEDNAKALQKLLLDDFAALPTMDENDARRIADPKSGDHIERQLTRMQKHPREYLGVRLTEDSPWLGFVELGTWHYLDEANHIPKTKRFVYTSVHKSLAPLGLSDVTAAGLRAFATKKFAETEPQEELDQALFDLTLERARKIGYKTIKCSVDSEDVRLHGLFDARDSSRRLGSATILSSFALGGVERQYALRELVLRGEPEITSPAS